MANRAFLLVKEKDFELKEQGQVNGNLCLHTLSLQASIESTGVEGDGLSENDCARLKVLLENFKKERASVDGESETNAEEQSTPLTWDLQVTFGLMFVNTNYTREFVRVTGPRNNNILDRLKSFLEKHQLKLRIAVKVRKFTGIAYNGATAFDHAEADSMETDLEDLSSPNEAQLNFSAYWDRGYWNPSQNYVYKGAITISCFWYPAATLFATILFKKRPCIIRKILDEELNSDVAIIANNEASIKCHKAFLSAHTTVFQAMFQGQNYKESETGTVEMPDMTEDGVKAFLAHLYLRDDDKADENSGIALELLQAGHKYHVASLEESMKCILLAKPDDWFEVDVAMKLFMFARNLPEGNALKMRAIKVLKKNFATLKTSETYKQLFKDDPEAAMEFCEFGFSI